MKIFLIVFAVLVVVIIAMRMIRTKKEGEKDTDGHIITSGESENSNLLFLALKRVGIN